MRRTPVLLTGFAVLALALSPGPADARAGGGSSFGSRGSMTYSAPPSTNTAPYSAAPMQRSMTPQYQPSPGYGSPMYQGGGLMRGLMGGLFAAGLFGLLFGHGFMGGGLGMFGFLGLLLQIVLVVALVRFLFRFFTGGRSPAMAGGPNIFARGGTPGPGPMQGGPQGGPRPGGLPPIAIGPADFQQFEQLLKAIQAAWSAHDLNALRAMATPEMVSYFGEQLAEQASRGVRNVVNDVSLVSGDLSQAWTEQGRDYATVAMRFSMVDVTRDMAGRVVDGSPNEHVTATEIWTFVRSRGGHWILSAIQQAR
ncbi:MAG: TIM44-like domain-containing protein [Rhodopila sp.]|jgi:predicted lipid-binding transport protein (Tim44 family)